MNLRCLFTAIPLLVVVLLHLGATQHPAWAQDEGGEIRIWTELEDEGVRAAFRRFEKLHPGWRIVETVYSSGEGQGAQKLMTAVVGGSPPDVIMQDRFTIGEWAARGACLNLDELVTASHAEGQANPIRREDFYDTAWLEGEYEGGTYGIPYSIDTRALFYNERHLRDAGLVDAEGNVQPPRDWDELREYTKKLTVADSRGRIQRLGFAPSYGNSWLYIYGFLNGGQFMSEDGKTVLLNSPEIAEALAYMTELYNLVGGVDKADAFLTGTSGDAFDPFGTGQISMMIHGDFNLMKLAEYFPNLPFRVAPPPPPPGKETTTWSGGFSFVIPQTAEHPDMGFELIKFMVSEEGWNVLFDVNSRYAASKGRAYIPKLTAQPAINERMINERVATDPNVPPRVVDALRTFYGLLDVSQYRPVTPVGQMLWDEHARATEQATRGGGDPQAILDVAAAKVQAALDEQLASEDRRENATHVSLTLLVPIIGGLILLVIAAIIFRSWRRGGLAKVDKREAAAAAIFLSPWLIGFMTLLAGPILASLVLAFCRYTVIEPAEWRGFENFSRLLFHDGMFWKSLFNTFYMLLGVPLGMAVGLGIALLLNAEIRGMKVYRTLFYLPAIVPIVASAILWIWVLNPQNGLMNIVSEAFGINWVLAKLDSWMPWLGIESPPLWLNSPSWLLGSKAAIIVMGLWGAGSGMIIWLAGLKGIPQHLYEAAKIDGATPWGRFRHVTLPMLTPYISFNLIIGTIGTMQIFAQAFIMTQGGPNDSTMFYAYYLFNNAFRYFDMGYASALAWVLLLIILALTALEMWSSKKWVHYGA